MCIIRESKVALRLIDDKRYFLSNGIDSVAYGHQLCVADGAIVKKKKFVGGGSGICKSVGDGSATFNFKENNITSIKRKLDYSRGLPSKASQKKRSKRSHNFVNDMADCLSEDGSEEEEEECDNESLSSFIDNSMIDDGKISYINPYL